MNVSNERSSSVWMATPVVEDAPALDKEETADVAIVGSGIAGMSVAYELAKAGKCRCHRLGSGGGALRDDPVQRPHRLGS